MEQSKKPLLSILITVYNRATAANEILSILYDYQQKGLNFYVVVSDNRSSDNIDEVNKRWEGQFHFYKFVKTEEKGVMDANFRNAYENCETDYCWLLGDTRIVSYDSLQKIIRTLEEGLYDALIINCHIRMKLPTKTYEEINHLMREQAWHITNNSSCIIPTKFINRDIYNRYMGTTFLHMGIFVENLCLLPSFKVRYLDKVECRTRKINGFKKGGWKEHPFLNFGKLWYEYIMALPCQITLETKQFVLKDHDAKIGLFSLPEIMLSKAKFNNTNYVKSFFVNFHYVKFVTYRNRIVMLMEVVLIPPFICKFIRNTYHRYKSTE